MKSEQLIEDFDLMEFSKGDYLITRPGVSAIPIAVKYLGDCMIDSRYFIAEDSDGDIYDDWLKEEFMLYERAV